MATTLAQIETLTRLRLQEPTARFWSSDELIGIITAGVKDLWRDIVNLKQEHFFTINESVTLAADTATLTDVPSDVHKVLLIEPLDGTTDSSNYNLKFDPLDYNDEKVQAARVSDAVDPKEQVIYYSVVSAGSPVAAPTIYIAPQVTSAVSLRFVYVPTISASLSSGDNVPIPGDVDNALVAWTIAYARAKERADLAPDPSWLATYKGEKDRILMSLGTRQLQDPQFVKPVFEEYTA
jgi:hypothetical protein